MATKKSQRIGILIIAIVMLVGTIGSFAAMMIAPKNAALDQQRLEKLQEEYQQSVDKQSTELSGKYYGELAAYKDRVGEFDGGSVNELKTEDLKVGDGEEIKDGTEYSAYYIGWRPDGKIFDQSIDGDKLKAPLPGGNMIEGWNEGVKGMKIGGVRELTIPSSKAYGETGQGEDIPPNTPLKFIVLAIPTPEEVEIPQELLNYYTQQYR